MLFNDQRQITCFSDEHFLKIGLMHFITILIKTLSFQRNYIVKNPILTKKQIHCVPLILFSRCLRTLSTTNGFQNVKNRVLLCCFIENSNNQNVHGNDICSALIDLDRRVWLYKL